MKSLKHRADKYRKTLFGPAEEPNRYALYFHESTRQGVDSQWFIDDAETPDQDRDGAPTIIFQGTFEEAMERSRELMKVKVKS